MSGTNNILPFSCGVGANRLTQPDYVADAQRVTGNQPGIARAPLVNKALAQATAIAAAIGSLIALGLPTGEIVDESLTTSELATLLVRGLGASSFPILLTAKKDLYVNIATGDDANDGLTALTPKQTIMAAVLLGTQFNTQLWGVDIHVADGDYSAEYIYITGMYAAAALDPSNNSINLIGNTLTPDNVIISDLYIYTSAISVAGLKVTTSFTAQASTVGVASCHFVSCPIASANSSSVYILAGVVVSGNAGEALFADVGSLISCNNAITVSGNPTYTAGFANAALCGVILFIAQPSGAATGPRFSATLNGVISTNGGGATWLPGSTAGVQNTGGQYA